MNTDKPNSHTNTETTPLPSLPSLVKVPEQTPTPAPGQIASAVNTPQAPAAPAPATTAPPAKPFPKFSEQTWNYINKFQIPGHVSQAVYQCLNQVAIQAYEKDLLDNYALSETWEKQLRLGPLLIEGSPTPVSLQTLLETAIPRDKTSCQLRWFEITAKRYMRHDLHGPREYAFRLHPKRWKTILEVQRIQDHPEGNPFPPAYNDRIYNVWHERLSLKSAEDKWNAPITPGLPEDLVALLSEVGFQLHARRLEDRMLSYSELHRIIQASEFHYGGQIPTYEEFVRLLKRHWPKATDLVVGPFTLAQATKTTRQADGSLKREPAASYTYNLPASCKRFIQITGSGD